MSGALERDEAGTPRTRLLPDRHGMVVRLQAVSGGRAALLDALHRYVDNLPDEPATEFFCVSLDPDDAETVWLHEWFHGEDGINAHRADRDAINIVYKSLQKDREQADISDIIRQLHEVVDEAIETQPDRVGEESEPYDISKIDFDARRRARMVRVN